MTCPVSNPLEWGSHFPPLMACLAATKGPVLEVGMGNFSTPVLHSYCLAYPYHPVTSYRDLVSVEENSDWFHQFSDLMGHRHRILHSEYGVLEKLSRQTFWSVVFIDEWPEERRAGDALLFKDSAEYIVIHDVQSEGVMGNLRPLLHNWKYQKTYTRYLPATIVLSNTREIPEGV